MSPLDARAAFVDRNPTMADIIPAPMDCPDPNWLTSTQYSPGNTVICICVGVTRLSIPYIGFGAPGLPKGTHFAEKVILGGEIALFCAF